MLAATMAPLVVLLGFAYLLVSPRLASAAKAKSNQSKAEHVQLLFNLSNAMQAERDRSAWYVATLGKTDEEGKKSTKRRKEQMLSARQTTGVALDSVNEFEVTLPEGQTTSILADVEAPRVIADSDSPDVDSLINFYNLRLEKVQNSTRSLENSSNAELLTAAAGLNLHSYEFLVLSSLRTGPSALATLASWTRTTKLLKLRLHASCKLNQQNQNRFVKHSFVECPVCVRTAIRACIKS
jgi:hypothetical protein